MRKTVQTGDADFTVTLQETKSLTPQKYIHQVRYRLKFLEVVIFYLFFQSATLSVMVKLNCRIWILIPILIQTANQMATLYNSELFIIPPLLERQVNKIVNF